jgi:predicted TIM-barrel fold metal-dependent hydrolase
MSGVVEERVEGVRRHWQGPVVDVDLHVRPAGVETLFPYLEPGWVEWIESTWVSGGSPSSLAYPPNAPTTVGRPWRDLPPEQMPDRSLAALQAQVLDRDEVEIAVLNPMWGVEGLRHPELAAAVARATNDWLRTEWLERDERLRGTVTVAHHDPAEAIREIERVGGHRSFVAVGLPVWSQVPLGRRIWHPLYQAIAEHDLVAAIHYGGVPDGAPTPTGWPAYHLEQYAAATQIFFTQLTSIIAEGVFDAAPTLRMSVLESGFTWLPSVMWRLNKEWKGLRRDIPWVKRPPAEIIRDHIRMSVQPLDGAPSLELERIVDWIGSDEMLMYASDVPRGQSHDIGALLGVLPEATRGLVMADNARRQYRL